MDSQAETKCVINPLTKRPIKIGSKIWLKLVKQGILEGEFKDPNVLAEIKEDTDVQEQIQEINKTLPTNEQGVRGRGKYKGQIVKRSKQPTVMDTAKHTAKTAASVIADPDVYNELQETDNFEYELEQLILAELSGSNSKPKKTSMLKKPQSANASSRLGEPLGRYASDRATRYQMVVAEGNSPVETETEYEEEGDEY